MTTPTASASRPQPGLYLDTPHQHTRSCFWDYLECRWQCPPTTATKPHDPTTSDRHRVNLPVEGMTSRPGRRTLAVDFCHVDRAVPPRRLYMLSACRRGRCSFIRRHARPGRLSGMRSVRTPLLTALAVAALTLTGCSTSTTGSPVGATSNGAGTTAPQATSDPVEWMDRVCGSLLPFRQTLKTAPPSTDDDPTATAESISAFLGRSETAIDKSLADLDAAGPSPVAGGDTAIAELKSALRTIRTSFDRTKTALDKIDPTNAFEVASTLPTVLVSLAELVKIQYSTTDLRNSPALQAAAAQAPNCQSLKTSG